jgi:Insertion element 4 transposase N-terminal
MIWWRRARISAFRVRDLPSRVVVYLLLAGCPFAELGYRRVWQWLVAGGDGRPLASPSAAGASSSSMVSLTTGTCSSGLHFLRCPVSRDGKSMLFGLARDRGQSSKVLLDLTGRAR